VLFPVVTPLMVRASGTIDGVTLLAGYHTAYNVVGVAVLLPLIGTFTRFVERLLPERSSPLTRCLDPSALATPIAAVEAVRRTVARALRVVCRSVDVTLAATTGGGLVRQPKDAISVPEAADALRQAQVFMSDVNGPPESDDEQRRLTSTLHALDHASRLAETMGEEAAFGTVSSGPDDVRAAQLCAEAMRNAASIAGGVAALPEHEMPGSSEAALDTPATSAEDALVRLERCAKALVELRSTHRAATLSAVANGGLTASEAIVRVDRVRALEALAHHAWRSAAHLVGRGE